jgi:hypothetical protein
MSLGVGITASGLAGSPDKSLFWTGHKLEVTHFLAA